MTRFITNLFATEIRAWRGGEPLAKVFWGYGVLVSSILALIYIAAIYQNRIAVQQILLLCFALYTVWILVAVWRCAPNTTEPWLGHLARALAVAWAINTLMVLTFLQLELLARYVR